MFRIGINLGDVVVEGDDLLGDGVNVAARLEQLCEPGGVLVSGTAYDQLQGKLTCRFDDLGERRLKNIERAVRVYAVRADGADQGGACDPVRRTAGTVRQALDRRFPFTSLGGETEDQLFADGITEDIIADLSRFRDLDVMASHSSFRHRGDAIDLRRSGRELGVRHVLSGSLRRQGDRVRVSARLVEVASGVQVWSERWERSAADVFAVQTEIAERTANLLAAEGVILHAAVARPSASGRSISRPTSDTCSEWIISGDLLPHDAERGLAPLPSGTRAGSEPRPSLGGTGIVP